MAKMMVQYGRSSRPLDRNLYGHPLAGLLWVRQFEKILLKHGWEKVSNWECLFEHREKRLFLSVYVDDIKLAGKKQNIDLMWKVLNKEVDLGEPTSFLDHVYLGCTQRQCQISKDIVDNYRTVSESRISAVRTEKNPYSENCRVSSWSYDMEVMPSNVWNDLVSWQRRRLNNSRSIYSMTMTTTTLKKWNLLENCQKYDLKLVWNVCTWHILEDLIFYGQWTNLHDRSQNGPKHVTNAWIDWSHNIHLACEYKQYCDVGNTPKQCILGLFSRLRFCRISWGFKIYIRWNTVRFWKSYICSTELDVQETNCRFAQFNRIRNLFRCRIEVRRYSRSRFMRSDCFCPCKYNSEPW